ncbi:phosphonate C-P lyase system protein PhnG [uncultured Roseobacter sp.]|uniref:phosphonate C-P lyase system protein PhnG n=1 Tax=uncultured Roseobacter sp. TaxID=114847 RepID=UPI00260541E2|nr:phosphonate C-P lyase system protein PhnG [uncultured Roseobacter sp.]
MAQAIKQTAEQLDRKEWMSLLAKAPADRLAELWAAADCTPEHVFLRAPEQGAVMVRGRTGATGAPFNLGEMTVTRCTARLSDGTVGHGYVRGRDKTKAVTAALIDALMQTDQAHVIRDTILTPLRENAEAAAQTKAAKAAATKVEFFTLVRGED